MLRLDYQHFIECLRAMTISRQRYTIHRIAFKKRNKKEQVDHDDARVITAV